MTYMYKAKKLFDGIWMDNGTHSEEYVIGMIAQGLEAERVAAFHECQRQAMEKCAEVREQWDPISGIYTGADKCYAAISKLYPSTE